MKQFACSGENTEKQLTFAVPLEKEVARINANGEEMTKDRTYILQFIDSTRFMTRSLSNLVNNLSEVLHSMKCKLGHYDIEYKTCVIKCKYCDCFLEYAKFKDDFIEYKCLVCNKNFQTKYGEKLK